MLRSQECDLDQNSVTDPETRFIHIAPADLPSPTKTLLAKLEEENDRIEKKAITSLPPRSREGSDASQISISGSISTQDGEPSTSTTLPLGNDENLWSIWGDIVTNWETEWKRRNQYVRDRVRKGIPHHFRGIVWQLLAGVESSGEKKLYAHYIKTKSACEKIIRRDIARTYPEHDFFKKKDGLGQESLFNVMKAYSLHDREVGYCQGSGFIVGLLLMQMPEEEAFAVLVKIMQQHRMRDMFKPTMAELGLCMFQLENLIQELLPETHVHFQSQGFNTSIYASSWFLTLFTTTLSLPLACRIMDVFLSEGIEIIFKVAIALLTLGQNDILSLDMENILKYIQKDLPQKAEADQEGFMQLAYAIKVNCKKMKKLEKEYSNIKSKEQADLAAIRCLRQENRILRQRVELLEKESSSLAERLVQGQVDRAEGAEESYALATDLQAMRLAFLNTQQKLVESQDEVRSLEITIHEINNRQVFMETGDPPGSVELAECLQSELVRARLQVAEKEANERELHERIAELESDNKSLRLQRVDNNVAHLQDALIAVKLREAEANLSLKELRECVGKLSDNWNKYMEDKGQGDTSQPAATTSEFFFVATPKKILRALEGRTSESVKDEEMMSSKIREAENIAELKELHLKVMELETQIQVSTNQLRRKDQECRDLKDQLEAALKQEQTFQTQHRELLHKIADIESKAKYDCMEANIKKMEDAQKIAELKAEISEYRIKDEVMVTEGELRKNDINTESAGQFHAGFLGLKAKYERLQATVKKMREIMDPQKLAEISEHIIKNEITVSKEEINNDMDSEELERIRNGVVTVKEGMGIMREIDGSFRKFCSDHKIRLKETETKATE